MSSPLRVAVNTPLEVMEARALARTLSSALGFGRVDAGIVDLAVSELATNIVRYAQAGFMTFATITDVPGGPAAGVQIECMDSGPGIADVELALRDGFSTGTGYGDGLPSVRRLMDDFEIASDAYGTRVTVRKWPTQRS